MSEHDPNHEAGQSPDGPKPAPSGTGPGGGAGDRPIPADGVPSDGGNTPADGSAPGDMDADALDGAAGTAGATADPRTAEDDMPASVAAEPAADDAASEVEAAEDAEVPEVEAEPAPEEPDWKDRYLRSVAELDNVRKRARRDAAAGEARGIARLAKELLPALDNLDRALAHVDAGPAQPPEAGQPVDQQLVEGVRIVHREIHAALSQAGIEAYDPTGEQFDPFSHEALTQQPAPEGTPPGTILAVYQAGYRRGEDVLRAAKVVVAG